MTVICAFANRRKPVIRDCVSVSVGESYRSRFKVLTSRDACQKKDRLTVVFEESAASQALVMPIGVFVRR
jgi:hypothetical protein